MTFDLEAAKRGEPIEYQEAYGWVELPFIGVWDSEHVVCKAPWNDGPEIVPVSKLRMAKKREAVRYRLAYLSGYGHTPHIRAINYKEREEFIEALESFKGWLTDWQEYEIGANDE